MNTTVSFHLSCSISLKPRHPQSFCAYSATWTDRNATVHDTILYYRRDEYLRFEIVQGVTTLTTLASAASMILWHISAPIPADIHRAYVERLEHPSGGPPPVLL